MFQVIYDHNIDKFMNFIKYYNFNFLTDILFSCQQRNIFKIKNMKILLIKL
jgi:hypothetical protein